MKIAEIHTALAANTPLREALIKLIRECIASKRLSFSKTTFNEEYNLVSAYPVTGHDNAEVFQLNFDSFWVCSALAEVAEEILGEQLPGDIQSCLAFADRFDLHTRQPKPNHHWSGHMHLGFESYLLVYLNQVHGVDITGYFHSLTDEMKEEYIELRSLDIIYQYAFPFLSDDIPTTFKAAVYLFSSEDSKISAFEALKGLGQKNPDKGHLVYEYSKEHGGLDHHMFLPSLLQGLYPSDRDKYFRESLELYSRNRIEGIMTLAWLDYNDPGQITNVFQFIADHPSTDAEYLRELCIFYFRLIENKHTPPEIRTDCFALIKDLTLNPDEELRGRLSFRLSMIDGYDEEKFNLIPELMAWGKPEVINRFFDCFKDPKYLFELIRESFLAHGMKVNFSLFKNAISHLYHNNPEGFEKELLSLLSHELAIIRFAGIQVLTSRHGGSYDADFLKLDETQQLRIIETLLPLPMSIEDFLPPVLRLRNSPYLSVKKKLETELTQLIHAYDHHLIEMVKSGLQPDTSEDDKGLLSRLEGAYAQFKKDSEMKNQIKEFNPIENELEYVDMFYRLEHEQQAEMMEQVQRSSIFAQLAKNISVIRGSGFNSETNKSIALMGTVGASRLIDRRYSMNPEAYEWNFKMNATSANYTQEPEA